MPTLHRLAIHPHTHAFLVRFDHHALTSHPPHHVERLHGLTPQRQFLHVACHATLDRLPQLLLDREEPVRRAHPLQRLVGTPVVVVLDPVADPFPRFLERLEASPHQELLLQRLPEPLDLSQRHRMLRRTADVMDVIPLEFLLELGGAPPTGVLPPVVRKHLLGRPVCRRRITVDFHYIGAGLAAVHPQSGDVPRIIIDEPDDIRRLAQDGKVRDVALPHLVGRRALEPARGHLRFLAGLRFGGRQSRRLQVLAHCLRTSFETEEPPQYLRDPPRPMLRLRLLQLRDLLMDRRR